MQKDSIDPNSYEGLKSARKKEEKQARIIRAGALILLVGVIVGVAYLFRGSFALPPSSYVECSNAIRSASSNPTAAVIPYVKTHGDLTSWKHGDGLRLQNQYGAMIDTKAACITDGNGTVTGLSINGETIF